jgi:putative phosphoribosyl transferase
MSGVFKNREEAGRLLAQALAQHRFPEPVVVIALPRGGVPVAAAVARALHAPLDLLLVRKIGAPRDRELAVGAVAEGTPPAIVTEPSTLEMSGADHDYIEQEALQALKEIERHRRAYLAGTTRPTLTGATVLLVDDGLATGTTARAALAALRSRRPARVVLAVPVAPADTLSALRPLVDGIVCLRVPEFFGGVGCHYADFHQVGDDEVIADLRACRQVA